MQRALREGMGLVLEGSHMMPGVLGQAETDSSLLCVLDVPDRDMLLDRALSEAHVHRRLSDEQLARLLQLQEDLVERARALGVPVVMNDRLEDALDRLVALATEPATPLP